MYSRARAETVSRSSSIRNCVETCPRSIVHSPGFRVQGRGFRVPGSGCRVQGSGCREHGLGFRVHGSGSVVQGAGFRIHGEGTPWNMYAYIYIGGERERDLLEGLLDEDHLAVELPGLGTPTDFISSQPIICR
jgi:hypothetical protein